MPPKVRQWFVAVYARHRGEEDAGELRIRERAQRSYLEEPGEPFETVAGVEVTTERTRFGLPNSTLR